jgi:Tat protein translocase TatB subunit
MDSFFGIGIAELFVIAVIALIVLGPERLPGTIREVMKFSRQIRNLTSELTSQFTNPEQAPARVGRRPGRKEKESAGGKQDNHHEAYGNKACDNKTIGDQARDYRRETGSHICHRQACRRQEYSRDKSGDEQRRVRCNAGTCNRSGCDRRAICASRACDGSGK